MSSMKTSEKNLRGLVAARRAEVVLSDEQRADLEAEKAALLASLERAEQHDEPRVTNEPDEADVAAVEAEADAQADAQTVEVVTGLKERAATVRAAQEQSDVDRLAAVKNRLRPLYEKARDTHRGVLKLRAQHAKTLTTLEHLDWKWVRESLSGTVYMPRALAAQHALDDILTMHRSLDRMWEITRDGWRDLSLARLPGLPDLEYLMKHLGECEYSARQDFFKLRDAVTKLDAAMKAADGEKPTPASPDAFEDARATAATRAENFMIARAEITPLPAKPDESRLAPGRVRDKSPFEEK